jgi:hypothetical protein
MMKRAAAEGLSFRSDVEEFSPAIPSPIIDSYQSFLGGLYRYLIPRFQRVIGSDPEDRPTEVESTINETIDSSVFERWRTDESYRPPNLEDWAKRKAFDLTKSSGSLRADNCLTVPEE